MNGLEVSKEFFYQKILPILNEKFDDLLPYMACGLVGEGSECFGLDDDISKDHDFGPGFCIWLPDRVYRENKERFDLLKQVELSYKGMGRELNEETSSRLGVFSIESFYYRYTASYTFPMDDMAWLRLPENHLATATNGQIYFDNYGEFTRIRKYLKDFYPKDVFYKKLAAYMAEMGQSGQYNFVRSMKRGDKLSAFFSKARFVEASFGALFLLAGEYKPYYKLTAKSLKKLAYYPQELFSDLEYITISQDEDELVNRIEKISSYIERILIHRGLIDREYGFLILSGQEISKRIENKDLRALHLMEGNRYA